MAKRPALPHLPVVTSDPDQPAAAFDPLAVLRWHAENGIDTVEGADPQGLNAWTGPPKLAIDLAQAPTQTPASPPAPARTKPHEAARGPAPLMASDAPMPKSEAIALAETLAAQASDLPALKTLIDGFTGCPLHQGARQAVVYDGVPGAPILVMGEAPGRDEDREGLPFVGRSGQLLDRMLAAIGASRHAGDGLTDVLISNAIFWRPPGNRTPTKAEVAVCLPFMRRIIELASPRVLLLTGNVPTQALYADAPGITKTRGRWREHALEDGTVVPALPIYHPAFLLRQPIQKRLAWQDLQAAKAKLAA